MPKQVHECVNRLMQDPKFNPKIGSGKGDKTKEEIAWAICNAKYKECTVCEIEDNALFMEALETILKDISIHKNIEQFTENITAQLTLETAGITKEDIDKVNKLTIKPVESKDIVIYPVMLIDDQITRNNTQYPKEFQNTILSLPVGEGNFIGAPVLFGNIKDHQETASAQVGRIFDAYQVVDKEKHFGVLGKMFILKENNEDMITKIDAGVLKEVSIATKVEFPKCSICGQNIQTCSHERGKEGCYAIMSGNGFCGEVSFVAVPGSDQAKILKNEDLSNYVKLEANLELLKEFIKTEIHSSIDTIKTELISIKENITAKDPKGTMPATTEPITNLPAADIVAHQINLYEKYNEIIPKIEKAKEYVIKYTARFNLMMPSFNLETLPKIEQGMKGIDEEFVSKICLDNTNRLDNALAAIESTLNFSYGDSVSSYAGDVKNNVEVVKYISNRVENILQRIYRLQGRFTLEDLEKDNLITETIRLGTIIDKVEIKDKEVAKKFFQNLSKEEVNRIKDMFFKEGTELFKERIAAPIEIVKAVIKDNKDLRTLSKKILNKEDK